VQGEEDPPCRVLLQHFFGEGEGIPGVEWKMKRGYAGCEAEPGVHGGEAINQHHVLPRPGGKVCLQGKP